MNEEEVMTERAPDPIEDLPYDLVDPEGDEDTPQGTIEEGS